MVASRVQDGVEEQDIPLSTQLQDSLDELEVPTAPPSSNLAPENPHSFPNPPRDDPSPFLAVPEENLPEVVPIVEADEKTISKANHFVVTLAPDTLNTQIPFCLKICQDWMLHQARKTSPSHPSHKRMSRNAEYVIMTSRLWPRATG